MTSDEKIESLRREINSFQTDMKLLINETHDLSKNNSEAIIKLNRSIENVNIEIDSQQEIKKLLNDVIAGLRIFKTLGKIALWVAGILVAIKSSVEAAEWFKEYFKND